ncbi:MAG: ABC transporter substrate-binding protein [Alphaproteobacteria bacterium]|jgi:peptide/nickel transport system substrate-binding protein|nr:ABC transporter substrate-binding protein [Alphaproteobacteria bacterium]MBT4016384.1 ABC transporter substrate-binding protein [Alphaproteobacteria bacterium]MBT5159835.1 ABC transporter substrate-binding protein [Alphaproteobacteria bacterium]
MIKRLSKLALGGVLVAAAALTSGQSDAFERANGEKIMVIAGRQGIKVLDPSVKYDATIRTLQQAVYDGLVKYEGTPPQVKPWLAESWSTSADGLVWTFKLVKNAKFHNGDPVDAEAVRFSFERTLKLNKGPAWMLSAFLKPENIKAVDSHTVQFTLDKPYSPLISFMPWWYIMNPKQVLAHEVDGDSGQKWLIDHEAGSGPFTLKRFEQGKLYELSRVKDYWRGFPYEGNKLGGIIYRLIRETSGQRAALIRGEADIVTDLSPDEFDAVSKRKGFATSTNPALTAFGLKFNTKGKHMSDINLRKAVAWAFDYGAFDKIYNGKAQLQTSPFTDSIKGKITVPGMPRHDVAKAKEYLAKSKWPNGGLELDYVYVQGFEEERKMGLVLIDSLKDINITVKMVPLTWPNMKALGSKVETSPDMLAIFATPVSTDPDAVAMQYHPESWGKYYGTSFYDNKEVHKLIEKARFTQKWEDRAGLYAEIQKRIVADQPEIFGMMRERRIIFHDYVKGFNYSPVRMTTEIDYYPLHIGK